MEKAAQVPPLNENEIGHQIVIEAGSRSPLHNPASTHGRLATTDLKLVSLLISRPDRALPFTIRPQPTAVSRQPNLNSFHFSIAIAIFAHLIRVECRTTGAGQRTDRCSPPAADQTTENRAAQRSCAHGQFIPV